MKKYWWVNKMKKYWWVNQSTKKDMHKIKLYGLQKRINKEIKFHIGILYLMPI